LLEYSLTITYVRLPDGVDFDMKFVVHRSP